MRKGIGISGIVRAWGLKDLHYTVRILFLSGSMTRKQLHHALDTALGNIEEEVISIDDLLDSIRQEKRK